MEEKGQTSPPAAHPRRDAARGGAPSERSLSTLFTARVLACSEQDAEEALVGVRESLSKGLRGFARDVVAEVKETIRERLKRDAG